MVQPSYVCIEAPMLSLLSVVSSLHLEPYPPESGNICSKTMSRFFRWSTSVFAFISVIGLAFRSLRPMVTAHTASLHRVGGKCTLWAIHRHGYSPLHIEHLSDPCCGSRLPH